MLCIGHRKYQMRLISVFKTPRSGQTCIPSHLQWIITVPNVTFNFRRCSGGRRPYNATTCSRHFQLDVALPLTLTSNIKEHHTFPTVVPRSLRLEEPVCGTKRRRVLPRLPGSSPKGQHALVVPLVWNHVVRVQFILLMGLLAFWDKKKLKCTNTRKNVNCIRFCVHLPTFWTPSSGASEPFKYPVVFTCDTTVWCAL